MNRALINGRQGRRTTFGLLKRNKLRPVIDRYNARYEGGEDRCPVCNERLSPEEAKQIVCCYCGELMYE